MWPPAGATRTTTSSPGGDACCAFSISADSAWPTARGGTVSSPIGDRGGDLRAHGDARSRRRRPPRSRPAPRPATDANPSPAVSPGVGAHALDDRAAAIDLARAPAARPRPRAPDAARLREVALQIARDHRDRRQRRQQLVRRARRQRRQRRQPLLALAPPPAPRPARARDARARAARAAGSRR